MDALVITGVEVCKGGTCHGISTVGVLLGKGDGTFQPAVTYDSGGLSAHSVVVADLNSDGRPDLMVENGQCCGVGGGVLGVLLGNGDGTFQPVATYKSGAGGDGTSVAVADLNGDGKLDVVATDQCASLDCLNKGLVALLVGNGDGKLQAAQTYDSGGFLTNSLAVADINGDGKPDLVVANICADDSSVCKRSSVGVLLNNTTLGKSTTSTSFVSSLNPSIYGQKVTWTAAVTSSGSVTPTGTVRFTSQFFTETFTIGSATLNSSGVATLTRSNLIAATHPLKAVYAGDVANLGSTSTVVNQVVLETTSKAMLTSSPNPSTQGQAVTFTATISSPTVIPTGPITFIAGTTVLGTAQLGGGKTKLVISSLPVGSTKVTVKYNGDSNIAKSSAFGHADRTVGRSRKEQPDAKRVEKGAQLPCNYLPENPQAARNVLKYARDTPHQSLSEQADSV